MLITDRPSAGEYALLAVGVVPDAEATMAVFQRLRERATQAGLDKFDWAEWRAYRDQDRP
jgi:hypothetical protein